MPLFESIEGDVAAFFVSQGSVFDALVRSFMERMARAESRVDALACDVHTNYASVNQLVKSISATMDAQMAATLARIEQVAASTAAIQQTLASITYGRDGSRSSSPHGLSHPDATVVHGASRTSSESATTHMDSHELEYYIMTLARQLHVVLELFFQPHVHDIVSGIQSKQAQFATISDVLTHNEAILMDLSALDTQQQHFHVSLDELATEQQASRVRESSPSEDDGDSLLSEREHVHDAIESISESANEDVDDIAASQSHGSAGVSPADEQLTEDTSHETLEPIDLAASIHTPLTDEVSDDPTATSSDYEAGEAEGAAPSPASADGAVNGEGLALSSEPCTVTLASTPSARLPSDDAPLVVAKRPRSTGRRSSRSSNASQSRKKSLYDSFRDFHELQLSEEERQRLQEQAMLRKVQDLLLAAKRQWRDEAAASMALEWQNNVRALESQQLKLQSEWKNYLEQQQQQQQRQEQQEQSPHSPIDLELVHEQQQQHQRALDQQLQALSDSLLAAQQAQEHEIARLLATLRDVQDTYVPRADFAAMATAWLQTARDECIFGVNADALEAFKLEMEAFQRQLVDERQSSEAAALSPALETLLEEVNRVLALLTRVLELLEPNGAGLHGPDGFELMQTLRSFLTSLDDLTHNVESDRDANTRSAVAVAETLRQMELGTANLLEAFETQQERYQQAFEAQQLALAQLQRELFAQRQADEELKSQLAVCPSQEDTMRFIQELRDQIHASASDSTTRMLATVDELRLRMGGLPSADVVDRLAQALQRKADRAEMDRLEKLLAAANSGPVAPVGSLMKAPMKCLACDQNLPYTHSSSTTTSASLEHGALHHHTCSAQEQSTGQQYYSALAPASSPLGRELFATSAAASRRRKQRQQQLNLFGTSAASSPLPQNNWLDAATARPGRAFVNLDDGRNRIPLRRTVLSDQVVYGPAITPNAFKRRSGLHRFEMDPQRSARPKTALSPNSRRASGGEIITRSTSSTVVIRPFAEQTQDDKRSAKQ